MQDWKNGHAAATDDGLAPYAYDTDLSSILGRIRRYPAVVHRVKDGRVVLKPNFVEFHEGRPINTDVRWLHV